MNSCELRFPTCFDAAAGLSAVRWQLFLHPAIREVAPAARSYAVVVRHDGDPDPEGWASSLAGAGLPRPGVERVGCKS